MEKFLVKNHKIIVAAILTLFAAISLLNANNDSATFDEVAHIPAGYSYVKEHDTRLNPEHPPLIKDLAGLPLLFQNLKFDTSQPFWTGDLPNKWDEGQWAAGRHLLYEAGNNPDKIIFWSRVPIVLLSVLLGLLLFIWGKELAGTAAGIFALVLFAFDPNVLGHNHFVTTDIGIAAFLAFSFYFFLKFIKHPTWKNVLLGGLFLGLLLVSKFSSIVALPVFGIVLLVYPLVKNNRNGDNGWKQRLKNLGSYLLKGIAAFAVATVVIWCVYKVNSYAMPAETFSQTIDFFFSVDDTNAKASITNKTLHALNGNGLTRPLGQYVFGPAWMFKRVSGGNGAYFMQQVSSKAFPMYFPVVFAIKETIPMLLLILATIGITIIQVTRACWRNLRESGKKAREAFFKFLRTGVTQYAMLGFIVLYSYMSITGNLNIGLRHLFPIMPFIYLLVAKKIFDLVRNKHVVHKNVVFTLLAILTIWIIAEPVIAYPAYTSYFNEAVGGPKNGYHYVTDSNADWGQDLKRLRIYLDMHPEIKKIHIDYFGGGNVNYYIGDRYVPWYDSKRPVETGWYAISVNFLQGSLYDKTRPDNETYRWLTHYQPVAQVGTSILIYDITTPPPAGQ